MQGAVPVPDTDLNRQREVVDAFLAAAHNGDFEALVAALDAEVVLRADRGGEPAGASRVVRGARAVAEQALTFSRFGLVIRRALVNGAPGVVAFLNEKVFSVLAFTVTRGKIVEIDILADPARLRQLDLRSLGTR